MIWKSSISCTAHFSTRNETPKKMNLFLLQYIFQMFKCSAFGSHQNIQSAFSWRIKCLHFYKFSDFKNHVKCNSMTTGVFIAGRGFNCYLFLFDIFKSSKTLLPLQNSQTHCYLASIFLLKIQNSYLFNVGFYHLCIKKFIRFPRNLSSIT